METITRRDFLKRTLIGTGSIVLAGSLNSKFGFAQSAKSKVIVVRHPEATDGVKIINTENVHAMMEESVKAITGKPSLAEAWASLLPNFKKEHIVAIKVNAISAQLPTHPEVVEAIVAGLKLAGVPENNIIIYDIFNQMLTDAGYKYNVGDIGVRCFGTDEDGWGYDSARPVNIEGQEKVLSKILTQCDHLINVPVLKVHLVQYGVTLSLKNHFGSVKDASTLHGNFSLSCSALNDQDVIKKKTRLIVIDALFGFWGSVFAFVPDFVYNGLIVSTDPVAADYVGTQILNAERERQGQLPRIVPLLDHAADLGLGTNDPEKIDLQAIEITSKSIRKIGSYYTKWGYIKQESIKI